MPFVLFLLGLIAFAFAGLFKVLAKEPDAQIWLIIIGGILACAGGLWVSRGVYPWRNDRTG